jgi:hypothetical protein
MKLSGGKALPKSCRSIGKHEKKQGKPACAEMTIFDVTPDKSISDAVVSPK